MKILDSEFEKILTSAELSFLRRVKLPSGKLCLESELRNTELRRWMTRTDQFVYIGLEPCPREHRLYLRTGRCLQCRPEGLSYLVRMSKPGFIYVGVSKKFGIVKIGCTDNVEVRFKALVREAYGGFQDWRLVEKYWCSSSSGYAEHLAHLTLVVRKFRQPYQRDGRTILSRELFACTEEEGKRAAYQGWRLARNEDIRSRHDSGDFTNSENLRVLLPP